MINLANNRVAGFVAWLAFVFGLHAVAIDYFYDNVFDELPISRAVYGSFAQGHVLAALCANVENPVLFKGNPFDCDPDCWVDFVALVRTTCFLCFVAPVFICVIEKNFCSPSCWIDQYESSKPLYLCLRSLLI